MVDVVIIFLHQRKMPERLQRNKQKTESEQDEQRKGTVWKEDVILNPVTSSGSSRAVQGAEPMFTACRSDGRVAQRCPQCV